MWPRRCRRGRHRRPAGRSSASTASMWPRRCRRGRPRRSVSTTGRHEASMWPRRCRRGRHPNLSVDAMVRRLLQCGHGDVAGGDTPPAPSARTSTGFNVATAMSPWKNAIFSTSEALARDASMWPRRCRRGRREWREWTRSRGEWLRCGHGDVAVEDVGYQPRIWPVNGLQCGHGDVAVEDGAERFPGDEARGASMWPRRCRRGRPIDGHPVVRPPAGFNVATAMSPSKTNPPLPPLCDLSELQCGHGDVAVETARRAGRL